MGYDMHLTNKPEGEQEAVGEARERCNAAVAVRDALPREEKGTFDVEKGKELGDWDAREAWVGRTDRWQAAQDQVMAAYDEMSLAERSYFRLNVWGMGHMRQIMWEFGMVFEDDAHPEFPDPENYGVDWDDMETVQHADDSYYAEDIAKMDAETYRQATAANAAMEEVLAFHGQKDTPGIPIHKFGSNDGWIVLPVECKAALKLWQQAVEERGEENCLKVVETQFPGRTEIWWRWLGYLQLGVEYGGFEVH